jgi:multiple sugar transport system permease protein
MKRAGSQGEERRYTRRMQRVSGLLLNYGLLTLAALIYIAPIAFMIVGSLKPDDKVLAEAGSWRAFFPEQASLRNYADVFERVRFAQFMFNSLFITGSIVVGGLIINSLAGYAFARLQWKGRNIAFALVMALMILPFEAIAVPLFYQVTIFGWRNTYVAQIIPFMANAFSIYLFYSFFIGMPRELEESARIDGAGALRIYVEVIVPNAKPAFASVTIVSFLFFWGFFLWPLMVTSGPQVRPLPVGIAEFQTLPPLKWGDIMAFGVMMVTPVLVVFLIFQRWFVRGIASAGIKG